MPFLNTFPTTGDGACCDVKTGCPLIGFCLPSFFGKAGATLEFINEYAWSFMVTSPFYP
jgi:hypothetical protein